MARRLIIMGAAGRDFHNFNVVYRDDPQAEVVAFTATQIPGIDDRRYPPELAGPHYPAGIPIFPEADLERLITEERVDTVVFAYSDVSHEAVMHAASRVLAAGADFVLLGPDRTMLPSRLPVIAVCAVRTGAGKSQTTRRVAEIVAELGLRPALVRHPMPYGDLARQAVQRFGSMEDLERHETTIEEREEYEPHIAAGRAIYAGVDYEAILRQAEAEGDVVIWDGGNNDLSFYRHDLLIVVTDPLRLGDETRYHPGEANLRRADLAVINKIDTASPEAVAALRHTIGQVNPHATIIEARSELTLEGESIEGREVVVVEDGPTLTHGEMRFGAGSVAAHRWGATVVDPRPHAVGSLRDVLAKWPHLDPLLPAMGYGAEQVRELEETLNATPANVVLAATPIDLGRLMKLNKPIVRVRYDLVETDPPVLRRKIEHALLRRSEALSAGARPAGV
ncbi:MAG TPA: cyclic 2,3-diphosphoglycerate synthase [Candidatus Limnocylindria bacterium]